MSGIGFQVIEQGVEHLPVIAATAGYLAGATMDVVAQRQINQTRAAVSAEFPDAINEANVDEMTRRRRFAGAVMGKVSATGLVSVLAVSGLVAGYYNGEAWQPDEAFEPVTPAAVVVTDGSGITGINGAQARIVRLAGEVGEMPDVDVTAQFASGGTVSSAAPSEIGQYPVLGEAPLRQGLLNAIADIRLSREDLDSNQARGGAVLLITDGRRIPNPGPVIELAEENGIPVSVVNVEANSDDETVEALRDLASETDGQYLTRQQGTSERVINELQETLATTAVQERQELPEENPWKDRVIAALTVGMVAAIYKARKTWTVWRPKTSN